jgi:hypothetical protein
VRQAVADRVDQVAGHPRSRKVLVFTLLLCLLSAGLGPNSIAEEVVDTVDVQKAIASEGNDTSIVPAVAQPQPSADGYDTRLYRADLARAKQWGS